MRAIGWVAGVLVGGCVGGASPLDTDAGATGGQLDATFGDGGVAYADPTGGAERGRAVLVSPEGGILMAGKADEDFLLVRFLADGTVDEAFGDGGHVATDLGDSNDEGKALALDDEGRILLGGITTIGNDGAFGLVRYTAAGALDATFGKDGVGRANFGAKNDEGKSLAGTSDGGWVMAGRASAADNDIALARFDANGRLDAGFGKEGLVRTDLGGDEEGNAIQALPGGKLLVAGFADDGSGADFVVVRYGPTGELDPTFGDGGVAKVAVSDGDDLAFALAVGPDGAIVAAGVSGDGRFAAVRLTADGSLDPTFGVEGVVTIPVGTRDQATGVGVAADGRIVLGGASSDGGPTRFAAVRLAVDGSSDASFGEGGVVVLDLVDGEDGAYAMDVQADGQWVLAGEAQRATTDFALVRLTGGGT